MFKRIQKHLQSYEQPVDVSESSEPQVEQPVLDEEGNALQGRCKLCDDVFDTHSQAEAHLKTIKHKVSFKRFKIQYNKRIQRDKRARSRHSRRNILQYRLMRDLYKLAIK